MTRPEPANEHEPILTEHKVTVLLIDDQPMIGEAVRRMLAGEPDIVFHYCRDAAKALDEAHRIEPTVILQDLVMPDIDGLTLVKTFRANEADPRDADDRALDQGGARRSRPRRSRLGANDYIVKLPDRLELLARIRYHSKGYINLLQRNEAYRPSRRASGGWPTRCSRPRNTSGRSCPRSSRRATSGPTGGSSPRPSWGATRSATTGSTTTTSPSSCWTSAATGSARPCSRSRP